MNCKASIVVCVALLAVSSLLSTEATKAKKARRYYTRNFHPVYGLDCIQPPYVKHFKFIRSRRICAVACNSAKNCKAFTVSGGHCRLFVFDKCSKNVRSCSCDRGAVIFVRRQPGLRPGALCPPDFAYNRCGEKFKWTVGSGHSWKAAMANCKAERGLVIMAEPIDRARLFYLQSVHERFIRKPGHSISKTFNFYVGGSQDPGSKEPKGGWFWQSCRIPFNPSIWVKNQPDNYAGVENYAATLRPITNLLNDWPSGKHGAYCQCMSPFDLD